MMPLLLGPLAIQYGWRAAFLTTGVLGLVWMVHLGVHRPAAIPAGVARPRPRRLTWPNLNERRVWALVFSYALPAISPGPILTILALYLTGRLGLSQAERQPARLDSAAHLGHRLLLLGLGGRSRYAANNPRPVGMFLLLTAVSLTLGLIDVDDVGRRSRSRCCRSRPSSAAASRWCR